MQAVEAALPEELSTVQGELTSQETDGWYTLANTSSARIYLKQAFQENSNLLEQVVEPLTVITGGHNHKVNQVGEFVKDNLLEEWKRKLDSHQAESDLLFTVVNTGLHDKVDTVSVDVTFATCDFKEAHPTEAYRRMAELTIPDLIVKDLEANFQYDLPKDRFRQAYIARQLRVTLPLHLAPLSWKTFQLLPGTKEEYEGLYRNGVIDTPFVTVSFDEDLTVYDKSTHEAYEDFLRFEDRGDIGNEYIYFQPKNTEPIYAKLASVKVLENNARYAKVEFSHELTFPVSADDLLEHRRIYDSLSRSFVRSDNHDLDD